MPFYIITCRVQALCGFDGSSCGANYTSFAAFAPAVLDAAAGMQAMFSDLVAQRGLRSTAPLPGPLPTPGARPGAPPSYSNQPSIGAVLLVGCHALECETIFTPACTAVPKHVYWGHGTSTWTREVMQSKRWPGTRHGGLIRRLDLSGEPASGYFGEIDSIRSVVCSFSSSAERQCAACQALNRNYQWKRSADSAALRVAVTRCPLILNMAGPLVHDFMSLMCVGMNMSSGCGAMRDVVKRDGKYLVYGLSGGELADMEGSSTTQYTLKKLSRRKGADAGLTQKRQPRQQKVEEWVLAEVPAEARSKSGRRIKSTRKETSLY
ncbi:hypothetical protein VOLCADRAFT_99081 [Volvox carteri f. nagariensis]|uniref:Uncharacterized protein n=1 Tax=Volvox carteri f. nagariensis TaxID=3068 RepID=D8UGZ6_VOLCA|nr:uncharacterized protein VOLCADRAFT_99081 [Volvox carteri f. nagariensis]EFJ40983.1 hypothetical protein VOLCADRAFT_99081 [Volvox carteri f. nagariensis]|eukprot:XP_002957957.1 hypothetical protein VOLCADRAFT_99081 [Volvox carteri f. nagariensis]